MHLADLTAPDVRALDKNTPVVIPVAALESFVRGYPRASNTGSTEVEGERDSAG